MAEVRHGVVNAEQVWAVGNTAGMRSFRYGEEVTKNGKTKWQNLDIDNGNVVELKKLRPDQRDVWEATAPTAKTPIENIVIVATTEIMYDERLSKNLWQFYNMAENDEPATGYLLHKGDIFSVTTEAIDTALTKIEVGNVIELQADTKMKVVATATAGSTKIGTVIDVITRKDGTYIGFQVG